MVETEEAGIFGRFPAILLTFSVTLGKVLGVSSKVHQINEGLTTNF